MPDGYIRRYRHKQVYSMTQVTLSDAEDIPPHANLQMHTIKVGNPPNRPCRSLTRPSVTDHVSHVIKVSYRAAEKPSRQSCLAR